MVSSFDSPGEDPTGLAWDGQYLWNADAAWPEPMIYKLDPSDGHVVSNFSSPGKAPKGLAWDGQYLWNADSTSENEKIYKLDVAEKPPEGGLCLGTIFLAITPVFILFKKFFSDF